MRRLRGSLARLAPPPRVVDWAIFVAAASAVATGLLAWTGWLPAALLVDLHGIVGLTLAGLLVFKFARVARRVLDRRAWDRATPISVLLGVVAVAALVSGAFWGLGGNVPPGPWTTLSAHVGLGLLVIPILLVHLRARILFPSRTDASRRSALRIGGLLVAGTLAWRVSEACPNRRSDDRRHRLETDGRPLRHRDRGRRIPRHLVGRRRPRADRPR